MEGGVETWVRQHSGRLEMHGSHKEKRTVTAASPAIRLADSENFLFFTSWL